MAEIQGLSEEIQTVTTAQLFERGTARLQIALKNTSGLGWLEALQAVFEDGLNKWKNPLPDLRQRRSERRQQLSAAIAQRGEQIKDAQARIMTETKYNEIVALRKVIDDAAKERRLLAVKLRTSCGPVR